MEKEFANTLILPLHHSTVFTLVEISFSTHGQIFSSRIRIAEICLLPPEDSENEVPSAARARPVPQPPPPDHEPAPVSLAEFVCKHNPGRNQETPGPKIGQISSKFLEISGFFKF